MIPAGRGTWLLANVGGEEVGAPGKAARRIAARVGRLWALLFGGTSRLLPDGESVPWPRALGERPDVPAFAWLEDHGRGVAWIATVAAERELERRGVALAGPSPEVVRQVHDKAFALAAARRLRLEPAVLADLAMSLDPELLAGGDATRTIAERVASWPEWTGGRFVLKPRLGSSGRGTLRSTLAGKGLPEVSAAACARLARQGGAVLEPWLARRDDLSVQLRVGVDGEVEVLGTTRQVVSDEGGYLGSLVVLGDGAGEAPSSGSAHDAALRQAALALGREAAERGFTGACGVDAFTFVGPQGDVLLRPVVELNARYTMGTVALGVLERVRHAGRLGRARAALFLLGSEAKPRTGGLRSEAKPRTGGLRSEAKPRTGGLGPSRALVDRFAGDAGIEALALEDEVEPDGKGAVLALAEDGALALIGPGPDRSPPTREGAF